MTTRADGDARRWRHGAVGDLPADLPSLPWRFARQVHGGAVAVVDGRPGPFGDAADALVTTAADLPVAVLGADCALLALAGTERVLAVVHAGWRGLVAGVVERALEAMRRLGAQGIEAVLSPCIHPECYAFSAGDLAAAARRLGPAALGRTGRDEPAFDLPAAVRAVLAREEVPLVATLGGCTACDGGRWFSSRARREEARHALVAWWPSAGP
ncbi:MAG TPA: polyphenol oxidase family protein [Acidimicrobiales bacterium]|nr:polyphenol oxidase family protein [Acidimicrobiales bacterium]